MVTVPPPSGVAGVRCPRLGVVDHVYRAATSYMDAQAGMILGALDRLNLRESTIIVMIGGVRGGTAWRYVEWNDGRDGTELYDHRDDGGEHKNLAESARHVGTVRTLRQLLNGSRG